MEKKFIGAGLLAGIVAGLVSFVFARIYIEPLVDRAIAYEGARSDAEIAITDGVHEHGEEVVSRTIQQNLGVGVGTVAFGLIMGAFLAVAFTVAWAYVGRRHRQADPRSVAGLLAVSGFVAAYLIPFCAYPANPPAVDLEGTINGRTSAFLTITVLSVVFMIAAWVLAFYLSPRFGGLYAAIVSGAAYLVAAGIAIVLLPKYDEIPGELLDGDTIVMSGFPADVFGDFRFYSVLNQVILWTVLGLAFAVILTVIGKRQARAARVPASASAG